MHLEVESVNEWVVNVVRNVCASISCKVKLVGRASDLQFEGPGVISWTSQNFPTSLQCAEVF